MSSLNLATENITRRLILQKARHHPYNGADRCKHTVSDSFLPSPGFFSPFLTVLVRYRSSRVFSLGRGPQLPDPGFVPPRTQDPTASVVPSPTGLSPSRSLSFPDVPASLPRCLRSHLLVLQPRRRNRFGLFPFRSPLLREYSLFLGVPDVSVPRFPHQLYVFIMGDIFHPRVSHSDIPGCCGSCTPPGLFAVYHVLLRHQSPRASTVCAFVTYSLMHLKLNFSCSFAMRSLPLVLMFVDFRVLQLFGIVKLFCFATTVSFRLSNCRKRCLQLV